MQMQAQVMKDAMDIRLESQVSTVDAPDETAMSARKRGRERKRGRQKKQLESERRGGVTVSSRHLGRRESCRRNCETRGVKRRARRCGTHRKEGRRKS